MDAQRSFESKPFKRKLWVLVVSPLFWIVVICGGLPAVQLLRCQRAAAPFAAVGGQVFDSADGASRLTGPSGLYGAALIGSHITDDTLARLRPYMERLPNFKRLYLIDTSVTDDGLKHLKNLKQLVELNLSGTQVTAAGLWQLKGMRLHVIVPMYFSDDELAELRKEFRVSRLNSSGGID